MRAQAIRLAAGGGALPSSWSRVSPDALSQLSQWLRSPAVAEAYATKRRRERRKLGLGKDETSGALDGRPDVVAVVLPLIMTLLRSPPTAAQV